MARELKFNIGLPSVDDLFSSQESREEDNLAKIREIPIGLIDDFPDHPFKVIDNEEMLKLAESIMENGVLNPAILRPKEDGRYEIVAGHRRKRACILAGLDTLRSEVVELDRDQAVIYMVDSNIQRTEILPSEKAFSYKMRLEAMKRQGKRTDLTSVPTAQKSSKTSRELLGEAVGESQDQIRRYIRLTELIPELLEMVDEGKIALRPAVELSYLPEDMQTEIFKHIEFEDCTPSHAQTIRMRKLLDEGTLNKDSIKEIISEEKPNQKEKLTISSSKILDLLPKDLRMVEREAYIIKALTFYARHREKQSHER